MGSPSDPPRGYIWLKPALTVSLGQFGLHVLPVTTVVAYGRRTVSLDTLRDSSCTAAEFTHPIKMSTHVFSWRCVRARVLGFLGGFIHVSHYLLALEVSGLHCSTLLCVCVCVFLWFVLAENFKCQAELKKASG